MEQFKVWLPPDRVEALRRMSRRVSFESDTQRTWVDLLREAIDLRLANENPAAPKNELAAKKETT